MKKVAFEKMFAKEEVREATKFWSKDKKALALIYALGILAIFITIFVCHSSAYSSGELCYESKISPEVFTKWEITEDLEINEYLRIVRVKNPSRFTRIKEIKMELSRGVLIAYGYWIGKMLHKYEWDSKTQCYETVFILKFDL